MLCPKYVEREALISAADALAVERLYFERACRKSTLDHIKQCEIQVPQEVLAEYRKEYFDYAVQLRQAIMDCLVKYAKRCPRKCFSPRVDFKACKLYWMEVRNEKAN